MTDPAGLPTTLATSYPTTSAGSVGYMMSYPGRPMVPMQATVGMPYMPIGSMVPVNHTLAPGVQLMPMPTMMAPAPGMVASTPIQQQYRNQRNRKPNSNNKPQLVVRQPSPATISAPPNTTTSAAANNAPEIPKGPPVTVFVGNITEKAPDLMIRHILSSCGHVASWKRVQAFGFCEFGNPDAALRAIRLLHEMEIGTRKLVVKVDAKCQAVLDEYKNQKKSKKKSDKEEGSSNDVALEDEDDYLDNDLKAIDEIARKRMNDIIQDHHEQMMKYNPPSLDEDKPKTGAEVTEERVQQTQQRLLQLTKSSSATNNANMKIDLDTVDYAEDGKRDLISREIGKFREIMKANLISVVVLRLEVVVWKR